MFRQEKIKKHQQFEKEKQKAERKTKIFGHDSVY